MFGNPVRSWILILLALSLAATALPAAAEIRPGGPLEVRILMDNSGSMWPGYEPSSDGRTRSQAGQEFYWDAPWFVSWLGDFATAQSEVGAQRVSLSAFRSNSPHFDPRDLRALVRPVPLGSFRAGEALDRIGDDDWGRYTHLAPALERHSQGFEGLIWLITDNVVESGRNEPDEGVVEFFRQLRDKSRYRSVHLFKLPAEGGGPALPGAREPAMAVYGILVSPYLVSDTAKAHYDRLFRDSLLRHERPDGRGLLFPQQQHRKLKDLRVDALDLVIRESLRVDVGRIAGTFRENEITRLEIPCVISSNLTQHAVIAGDYRLRAVGSFRPDDGAQESLGLKPLSPAVFAPETGRLGVRIPPRGKYPLKAVLASTQPLDLDFSGLAWLRAALHGVRARYTGTVEMSFSDLEVDLQREELEGIFGAHRVPEIFDVQDVGSIQITPTRAPVTFILESGASRGLLLLALLLLIGVPLGLLGWAGTRQARYRVHLGESPQDVALRRLQSFVISHAGHRLGRLSRTLSGSPELHPNRENAAVRMEPQGPLRYQVSIRNGGSFQLAIEPLERTRGATGGRNRRTVSSSERRRVRRPNEVLSPSPAGPPPPGEKKAPGKPSPLSPPKPPDSAPGGGASSGPARPRPKIRRP